MVQGIGGGTTGVLQAYVGDATAPKDRAKALGWLSAATSAGVVFGPVIGSVAFSLGPQYPGFIAAGLCLTNCLFAWRWLAEPELHAGHANAKGAAPSASARRPVRAVFMEVVSNPGGEVPRLIWIYAVGMLGFMSMTAVMPLYLASAFGITERTIGPFFTYIGVLSFLMRGVVLGKAVDRFGETRVMRAGAVSLAIGLLAIPLPSFIMGTALVASFVPVGTAMLFPTVSALVSHRAPKSELGQTLGVQQSFGGVSRVIAPLWATAVFQLGMTLPFFIASGVVALAILLAFSVKPAMLLAEAA
jgi:MFS family permease